MNSPRTTPRVHVLVGCDNREHVFASTSKKNLSAYYQEFKYFSEAQGAEADCQNFIGWLLVCTDLQLVDERDREDGESSDYFRAPCQE